MVADVLFPVGRNLMEDASWTPRVMERCETVVRNTAALYHWKIIQGSLSHQKRVPSQKLLGACQNRMDRILVFSRHLDDQESRLRISKEIRIVVSQLFFSVKNAHESSSDLYQWLGEAVRQYFDSLNDVCQNKAEQKLVKRIAEGYAFKKARHLYYLDTMLSGTTGEKKTLLRQIVKRIIEK